MTVHLQKPVGSTKIWYIKQRIQHRLIFNIGGSTATQSKETERLCEVFTGVQEAGPLAGVARGQRPLA